MYGLWNDFTNCLNSNEQTSRVSIQFILGGDRRESWRFSMPLTHVTLKIACRWRLLSALTPNEQKQNFRCEPYKQRDQLDASKRSSHYHSELMPKVQDIKIKYSIDTHYKISKLHSIWICQMSNLVLFFKILRLLARRLYYTPGT